MTGHGMQPPPTVRWEHTEDGLMVSCGARRNQVPAAVATWLMEKGRTAATGDVPADVLRLEANLRDVIARLQNMLHDASDRVLHARAIVQGIRRSPFARRRRAYEEAQA